MTTTIGDYSVEINNLPLNISSRRNLANFFEERWGEIIDVVICYNDSKIIQAFQAHSEIIDSFTKVKVLYSRATKASTRAKETSKLQRLQTKLDKSSLKMLQIANQFENGQKQCVKAYVVFQNEPERNKCLNEYYHHGLCRNKNENKFIYEDNKISISPAPEPSNIFYLHHGHSKFNVFCRRLLTTNLSFLIILVSSGLIFAAEFAKNASMIDTQNCKTDVVYDSSTDLNCYCCQMGLASAMNDDLCSEYFRSHLNATGFQILSSFIIILVNLILQFVIYILVEKEKHVTVSSHQSALARKIFISQFINTALTILIINCNLNSINSNIGNIFNSEYDINFTANWCKYIGNSIVTTMIMGALNPDLLPILKMRHNRRKRENAIETVNTQNELNKMFEGEEFTLADRFADISVKICVILLYTPLLPLLWVILCFICILTYWFNKIFFLRIAAIPPKYDTALARNAVFFIKIGISLHLIMAIWVFGSKYRNPQYLDYNKYLKSYIGLTVNNTNYDTIFKIIFNMNSLPFLYYLYFCILHHF